MLLWVGLQLIVFLQDGVQNPCPSVSWKGQLDLWQFPLRTLRLKLPILLSKLLKQKGHLYITSSFTLFKLGELVQLLTELSQLRYSSFCRAIKPASWIDIIFMLILEWYFFYNSNFLGIFEASSFKFIGNLWTLSMSDNSSSLKKV